ncbi:hypothetical protein CFC21_003475 [Triticum aestivum]|uniref:Protodermal factor 1 n=1 Tax=Triticum aestivum TaxID=4565 RepID=A0A3B5Y4S2_WHEAT|nr:hypothetical protein CFC21_003475 [Triticum aestivum]
MPQIYSNQLEDMGAQRTLLASFLLAALATQAFRPDCVPSLVPHNFPGHGGTTVPLPSHGGSSGTPPYHGGSGSTPSHSGSGSLPDSSHGGYGTPPSHGGSGSLPDPSHSGEGYSYWRTHPMQTWSALGSWPGSVSHFFGAAGGPSVSIKDALANTRTDGAGALLREGTPALLNSMTRPGFAYTTQQVRDVFAAAAAGGFDSAAAAQAAAFKKANEGKKA